VFYNSVFEAKNVRGIFFANSRLRDKMRAKMLQKLKRFFAELKMSWALLKLET